MGDIHSPSQSAAPIVHGFGLDLAQPLVSLSNNVTVEMAREGYRTEHGPYHACQSQRMTTREKQESYQKPREKVLAIPELVEEILLALPIKDILVNAQRVNKTWHSVIQQSVRCQEVLFLHPIPAKMIPEGCVPEEGPSSIFGLRLAQDIPEYAGVDLPKTILKARVALNPFFRCLLDVKERTLRAQAKTPNASWRRMFLTQPPTCVSYMVRLADFETFGDAEGWEYSIFCHVFSRRAGGAREGDDAAEIYGIVRAMREKTRREKREQSVWKRWKAGLARTLRTGTKLTSGTRKP